MAGAADSDKEIVTAGLLVIGDEILSGRTKDKNIGYVAEYLTGIGIDLKEVRIVPDEEPAIVANPQSAPAITFSRPTCRATLQIRWATSSGCSIKFVTESITPGIKTMPSGNLTSLKTAHSCSWRGFDAS